MFQNRYTTRMSGNKRILTTRFTQIRSGGHARLAKSLLSAAVVLGLLSCMLFASSVMAATLRSDTALVSINGTQHDMRILHVDNSQYLYSDSYYVPLRDLFTALGCTVRYDIDRVEAPDAFQVDDETQTFPWYDWREHLVTDDISAQLYGATTFPNANMPIIEAVFPSGEAFYCQLGSTYYTHAGGTPPPILVDGKTYVPIRAVAYLLGGDNNVQWDGQKGDTYYEGKVTWDEANRSLIIDENAACPFDAYVQTRASLNADGSRILSLKENHAYAFCVVQNEADLSQLTLLAINKYTGSVILLDRIPNTPLLYIEFLDDREDAFALYLGGDPSDSQNLYNIYTVSE